MKATPSKKGLLIRVNLVFIAIFLIIYAALLLRPSSSTYQETASLFVRCSLRECHHKVENGMKMKAVLEETQANESKRILVKREMPTFSNEMGKGMKIGMINMDDEDVSEWKSFGETIPIRFEHVSELFEWKHLFPEWIDEEEDSEGPSCPEIPMPDYGSYINMDLLVAKLPCKYPEEGWGRDVFRLQVHLISANMGAKKARRDRNGRIKMVFLSQCRPMMELFGCKDMVTHEADWWFYEPEGWKLEQKASLPVGSCQLALPLWDQGIDRVFDLSKIKKSTETPKREAYVTVLHSSESYVCGAITLAQSLIRTGTKRDLVILLDKSISESKREALTLAGWKIRMIKRIRNPRAQKNSYNEYNYSKFRLWLLTDYDKVIFIDADITVLRNLDLLFHFPQMSATGNDIWLFNSGIMVIEPSNCTFRTLMGLRREIISYNGGDQGFLNEVFVWWHRLPRRMNFLKNFWSNTSLESSMKNHLFGSDPPKLYAIHYLGLKPWLCYRDYDCNWDLPDQRVYASDVAHRAWWKVHDAMDERLQKLCGLTEKRKIELEWDRKKARERGFGDEHARLNVSDPRRFL